MNNTVSALTWKRSGEAREADEAGRIRQDVLSEEGDFPPVAETLRWLSDRQLLELLKKESEQRTPAENAVATAAKIASLRRRADQTWQSITT